MTKLAVHQDEFNSGKNAGFAPMQALVLDDSDFDCRRIRRLTEDAKMHMSLDVVSTIDGLGQMLDSKGYDVILIDYTLPQGNGMDAQKIVKTHPKNQECPTILVTGNDHSEIAVQALQNGYSDYLAKNRLTPDLLKSTILKAIKSAANRPNKEDIHLQIAEKLAHEIASTYSKILQPGLARIVRHVRDSRTSRPVNRDKMDQNLRVIEQECVQLWSQLLIQNSSRVLKNTPMH